MRERTGTVTISAGSLASTERQALLLAVFVSLGPVVGGERGARSSRKGLAELCRSVVVVLSLYGFTVCWSNDSHSSSLLSTPL